VAKDENRRQAALVGEQVVRVDAASGSGDRKALCGQSGVELTERPSIPREGVLDVDGLGHGNGATVLDIDRDRS
jgi:hypothetical protein